MNGLHGTRRFSAPILSLMVSLIASCGDAAGPDPILLEVGAGDGQEAQIGTPLPAALIVHVMGLDSVSREGIPVEWTVVQGGGTIEPSAGQSDAEGRAQASWTLGSQAGEQLVRASAVGESAEWKAWADPLPPEDWSEVVEIRPAAEIDGETLQASIRLYNHWQGLLRLTTQTGCFGRSEYPALYTRSGERVAIAKAYGCTYAVTTRRVSPGDSLGFGWSLNVASVAPGDYTLLFKFAVFEINDAPDTLPNVETPVSLGG